MNETIEIVNRPAEKTLAVHARATMWQMPALIGRTYRRILACAKAQSLALTGAPYIRYLDIDWQEINNENKVAALLKSFRRKWDMEIGFPVAAGAATRNDIVVAEIPAGKYVQALHIGSYRKVGATYGRMLAWIRQQNLNIGNESIEIYLNDPQQTKKADRQTRVLIPLAE